MITVENCKEYLSEEEKVILKKAHANELAAAYRLVVAMCCERSDFPPDPCGNTGIEMIVSYLDKYLPKL